MALHPFAEAVEEIPDAAERFTGLRVAIARVAGLRFATAIDVVVLRDGRRRIVATE